MESDEDIKTTEVKFLEVCISKEFIEALLKFMFLCGQYLQLHNKSSGYYA